MLSDNTTSIIHHPVAKAKEALVKRIQRYIDQRYPGWNLDAALRYLAVAGHLNRSRPERVLDVGSGATGLSLYWGKKTIGLDVHITRDEIGPLTSPVKGTGASLPFKDHSVDVVVGSDLLEHIPPLDRDQVLSEMIRVARKEIIVATPCGHASHLAEVEVNNTFQEKKRASHPWLRQHLLYGLPEARTLEEEIRSLAIKQGRRAHIEIKNNMNLLLWRWLSHHYFGGGPRTTRLIRYYMLALIPLLRHINWGETYRKIFFVRLDPYPFA
jgi:ubiquinone/menaquinone biosynthesis C-methylase UbiE